MDILVVDDQKRTRQSLRILVGTLPYDLQVREAQNGREALQLMAERLPDLVIMDAKMPELDGVQATSLVKTGWPQVKVILLSMYPEYQDPGLLAGADAFVSKGEPPEALLDKVCELLGCTTA